MADLANRADYEARISRAVARVFQQFKRQLWDMLGDNPTDDDLDESFFADFQGALQGAVRPILEAIFVEHAQTLTETPPETARKAGGIGIDMTLINQRAADWAAGYSFELVKGIVDTTRDTLRSQIRGFFEDQRTIGDLRDSIGRLFGPVRASMIAITETTRAASKGEEAFADELRKLGLRVTHIWHTSRDDDVCKICKPRNGKRQGDGWQELPPAHIGCRCWTGAVVDNA